jgi:hypothetical protein
MPYKFTIVDRKTGRPIEGTVRFRSGSGVTPDAWDIPLLGAEVPEAVVESYDDIIVNAPGYFEYGVPVQGLYLETEFRLWKKPPVMLWAVIGAAAGALAVAYYFERKTT